MQFHEIDPRDLGANPWNSNTVSHENEQKLRASVERLGMFKPLIVREMEDGSLQLIGGQHRCEAAIEAGMQTVPVINLGRITEERAKEIGLIDNSRYGTDDTLKLAELLDELGMTDMVEIMPWSEHEIAAISASIAVDIDDLDLEEDGLEGDDPDNQGQERAPRTHEVLRFKCSLNDSARIRSLVNRTIATHDFNGSDDLTNAGDALAQLLLTSASSDD